MKAERQIPAPPALKALQEAFAASIRTPPDFGPRGARPSRLDPAVGADLLPRGAATGEDRLAVYQMQYWLRLFRRLAEDFPLLARTLGRDFEPLASAYLTVFPSRHFSVEHIGDRLPDYLRAEGADLRTRQIAELEGALIESSRHPSLPPLVILNPDEGTELLGVSLRLQPWFRLVEEDWNLMECRFHDYRDAQERPPFESRKGYWALTREDLAIRTRPLDPIGFRILSALRREADLGEACEEGARDLGAGETAAYAASLADRFRAWSDWGLFAQPA